MKLAVLLYSDAPNPLGFPAQYPSEVRQVDDSVTIESPWVEMTRDQIDSLIDQYMDQVQEIARLKESVPQEIETWKFQQVLAQQGLTSSVESAIQSLQEPSKTIAIIRWNKKPTIRRNNALTNQIGAAVGLTPDQIDDLFRTAENIQ